MFLWISRRELSIKFNHYEHHINPVSLQALAANGVAVVGPVFINDYLVSDTKPKVEDCLVEDFKTYWHARR